MRDFARPSDPAILVRRSHGFTEFLANTEAVLIGRTTFLPPLGHQSWPWADKQVFVLTSSPLPDGVPEGVSVTTSDSAAELLEQLRSTAAFGRRPSGRRTHHNPGISCDRGA